MRFNSALEHFRLCREKLEENLLTEQSWREKENGKKKVFISLDDEVRKFSLAALFYKVEVGLPCVGDFWIDFSVSVCGGEERDFPSGLFKVQKEK